MNTQDEKILEFSQKLKSQIGEMFSNEDCDNYIQDDLQTEEDFKCFIHALATVVPCSFYNKITQQNTNFLEFNYTSNALCFEFLKKG